MSLKELIATEIGRTTILLLKAVPEMSVGTQYVIFISYFINNNWFKVGLYVRFKTVMVKVL